MDRAERRVRGIVQRRRRAKIDRGTRADRHAGRRHRRDTGRAGLHRHCAPAGPVSPRGGDDRRDPASDRHSSTHRHPARDDVSQAHPGVQRDLRESARRDPRSDLGHPARRQAQRADDAEPAAADARGVGFRFPQGAQPDGHGRRRPEHARRPRGGGVARRAVRADGQAGRPAPRRGARDQGPVQHLRHAHDGRRRRVLRERPSASRCHVRQETSRRRRNLDCEVEHGRIRGRRSHRDAQLLGGHHVQRLRHRAQPPARRVAVRAWPPPRTS